MNTDRLVVVLKRAVSLSFLLAVMSGVLAPLPALAQDPFALYEADGLTIRAHLEGGINAVAEKNLFWNFSKQFAKSTKYDPDTQWLEGYLEPGISFLADSGDGVAVYGKISVVASGTLGIDAFNTGNTGRVTLEEGYLGLRLADDGDRTWDISVGPREFKTGTGMLLANGASSGFERGALKLGPRKAWEFATIGSLEFGDVTGTLFYLDANEMPETDSGTTIAGGDLRYQPDEERFAGITYGHVLESDSPYAKAAPDGIGVPELIPGARDGLNFVNIYGRTTPFEGRFDGLFVSGDFAYEWNEAIDLNTWAGRVQVGYNFDELGWSPTIAYTYQTFSGDDPSTRALERFDPLYFEGSPSAWSTGSKSSMMYLNSNVNSHQLSLQVRPTDVDILTLRYAYIDANHLRSPLQFGQGTRLKLIDGVKNPVAGVTRRHLSDDVFLEYNRVLNPNTYLTAGISAAFAGAGMDSITKLSAPVWTGAFVNVVFKY